MVREQVVIKNPTGLHLRPAGTRQVCICGRQDFFARPQYSLNVRLP